MPRYTVKQLAERARISVRALHHYDDIGLLKPAWVGDNGYRYYEQPELHRLQQILMYRDFGMALDDIKSLLDTPDFDVASALRGHRGRLVERLRSLQDLLGVIERTLQRIDGDEMMKDTHPHIWQSETKSAEYKQWLLQRYSDKVDSSIADVRRRITAMTPDERLDLTAQRQAWEGELVTAFTAGMSVEALAGSDLLIWHRRLTSAVTGMECTPPYYVSVADVYRGYGDYRDHFEGLAPGLTDWLTDGMKAWAALDETA